MMNSYETCGAPPPVLNKCAECGNVWCGTPRALCPDCAPTVPKEEVKSEHI